MSTTKPPSDSSAKAKSEIVKSRRKVGPRSAEGHSFVPYTIGTDLARRFQHPETLTPETMASKDVIGLQRMMGNQAVANLIARKAATGSSIGLEGGPVNSDIEEGISRARGGGAPLGKKVRSHMEDGFGTDFSKVRVHTGGEADTLNRSMSARAFTTGSDIFFQKGAYNPGSGDGRKLLAHELTHVVQQGGAGKVQRKLKVGPAKDHYEEEADQIASSVMRAPSLQRSPAGVIQRDLKTTLSNVGTSISTGVTNVKNSISTKYNNYKTAKQLKKQRKLLAPKKVTVGERIRDEMTDKSTKIVGKEDKRSIHSRDESAKSLDMSADERASGIQEAIATERNPTNLFKRVAFLLEGKLTEGIEVAYKRVTGEDLRAVINKNFTNRPHKHSGAYLLSVLDNQGEAPLKSRLWLTLGLVDGPVVSNERLVKLIERANFSQFKAIWPSLKTEVTQLVEQKTLERIEAFVEMQNKHTAVELKKASGMTVARTERDALAAARDKHLASIINFRKRELGKTAKLGVKVLKLATKIPMLAPLAPVPMMIKTIGTSVDTQRLTDDINKWRMSAEQEDILYLRAKRRTSAFEQALAALPRTRRLSNLRGLEEFEVSYLRNLATADIGTGITNAEKENKNISNSVFNSIQRGKGTKRIGKIKKRVRKMVGGGEWDNVMSQLTSLTSEQREELLNRFAGTTRIDKLAQMKVELQQAGFGLDKIGPIVAAFENTLEEAGSNYSALLDYIHGEIHMKGKLDKFKRAVSSPTQAKKSKAFGKKVLRIVSEFRGNEYAQLRQNPTLLATIETNSGKEWFAIMRLLGITSANNTLTGTNEDIISESEKKAEESPEYWATLIEKVAVKTEKGAGFNYTPVPPPSHTPGTPPPKPKKPAKVEKIRIDEIGWIVMRAQAVAQQVEEDTSNNLDAAGFMTNIYNALQPETQDALKTASDKTGKTEEKAIEKAETYERVYLALTDQANHPLHSKDAINKSMKKAKTVWYKRGWRPRPDRVKIVNSFSKLEGKELLDEWSNFHEYKGLYEGAAEMDTQVQKLSGDIDKKKDAITNETDTAKKGDLNKELDVLNNRMIKMMAMRREVDTSMKGFVLGIKQERNKQLLKMTGLVTEDRLKIIAMLNEKIIAAAESDTEVQLAMMMVDMDFDEWMKTKMRGVDALEMQRYIDHSRQWHLFSNKSSQLDEGTRRVVGTVRSGNEELREGQKTNKSETEIQNIKSRYVQKGEEELSDRKEIEAAFKDMRAKFNARASLIIRIITTALITAVSVGISAASMGIATPVMAAISGGMLLSQIAIHSAFDYFVLKKPISQVAVEASVAILQAAFTMLTMNLASAMNASFLHPDMFLKGSEWLAPGISKALSKTVLGIVMAYPKSVLKLAYNQQLLEKAIEAGKEKAMGETLLKNLAMGAAKPWLRFVIQSSIGGVMQGVEQSKAPIHEGIYGTPPSTTPSSTTPTTPPPSPTSDPGGFIEHQGKQGLNTVNDGVKGFLTPKTAPPPTPKGDLGTVFTSQETFNDNLGTMVSRQQKNLKKYAKKNAVGKDGQGGWLHTTSNSNQHRENIMGNNRDRVAKGMKIVTGGKATKLTTGVTPITTDVHVVYFGGGWRLEDTGTVKTATLNGQQVTGAVKLTPGDILEVGGTQYSVELGS